ncbi:MAG: Nramp family divalent metal transporter [Bacteroidota bacterium]|nr:Nramp family divalent metal transporter [Bacteroidota bacterium]MDP4233876.1 Nramp family divalent metal transporter [Bacteroidota bacterium]MDP4243549.1 Nramp family divalent metal transporter [Bacteroidota bacterium]MDP4288912.1 Nramp family divalent metal transporter [Bacteroidota bacterium]
MLPNLLKVKKIRIQKPHTLWQTLGPGLITGAADDDPSGVATYSQAGAQIGTPILWTMLLTWPLMSAIQMVSAQIGRVTGRGLSANIRKYYGAKLAFPIMLLIFFANVFNLGADISAMGTATKMLIGGPARVYAVLLTLASVGLQIYIPYRKYARVLKWLTFVLFAYVGVVFFVRIPWQEVAIGTFLPSFSMDAGFVATFVAVLGTTISPYLFFWQSSQEVEEIRTHKHEHALRGHPLEAPLALRLMRNDTVTGMGISNLIAYFIMLATAATLHAHNITNIATAEQAALALRPLAGEFCYILFALGILGTGLLALPVLAGSAAFAVAEAMHYRSGLEKKPAQAKRFYGILAAATLLGIGLIYMGLNPIRALYWSAVINGVISAPIMMVIMIMASRERIMGEFTINRTWTTLGWIATLLMAVAVVIFFMTLI